MTASFINLAKQCCDADEYLDMGYMCAKADLCYNSLRPVGDTLWFGIPYAFNTSENIFFYLHVCLLAIVSVSAFFLLKKLLPACVFLLVLLFLTWPTFFNTLSDTPATLFFIEGIVLALLGQQRNSVFIFFTAGISLGISVLLRAAYFYPFIIATILFCIYWLWQKKRQWPAVFMVSFVAPLSLQFFSTWQHTGQWAFLSEARSRSVMNLHLNSDAAGYDTYLPQSGAYWSPDCIPQAGLLPSLESADVASTACILKNRLSFYLGSYAASTFLGIDARNFFDNNHTYKINSAEKNASGNFAESKSLLPLPPGEYRYSVLLQGKTNQQIANIQVNSLTISPATTAAPAAFVSKAILNESITLTDTAQQYAVNINNKSVSYVVAHISSPAAFNVQAAALEPATSAQGFIQAPQLENTIGQNTGLTKNNRIFSHSYFIINCLVIVFAMICLYRRLATARSPVIVFIATLLFAVFVQCMIIIPEQRYMQGLLSACWLLSLLLLSDRRKQS